jgi:hypothetical protein
LSSFVFQWSTAAEKLDPKHDPPVRMVQIDAARYRLIGEKYFVDAYPQIKLLIDDKIVDFPAFIPRT